MLSTIHGKRAGDSVAFYVPDEAHRVVATELINRFELDDAADVEAIPGAADLLATMPAGNWAVVTSGSFTLATARLRHAGLPIPEALVTGGDVAEGKPHPEGYLAGAQLLGLLAKDCVVIEDAPAGIRAARAAGAGWVVGVGNRELGDAVPDCRVTDLRQLRWTDEGLQVD